jgi:hypothetical protein
VSDVTGGFAPDLYLNKCMECGARFVGSKPACRCSACASVHHGGRAVSDGIKLRGWLKMDAARAADAVRRWPKPFDASLRARIAEQDADLATTRAALASMHEGYAEQRAEITRLREGWKPRKEPTKEPTDA